MNRHHQTGPTGPFRASNRHQPVGKADETRLDSRLIRHRISFRLDLRTMPQEPPSRIERRLSAILAADVAGYSRLMGLDEVGTAHVLREHRAVSDGLVARHGVVSSRPRATACCSNLPR
jgi:class 3 adenylate cyclase